MSAYNFVNSLMFLSCNQSKTSLPDIVADLHQNFAVDISKEALHKRFSPQAVGLLKEMIKEKLSRKPPISMAQELKAHFPCIMIKDSCKYMLPGTYDGAYPGFGNFSKTKGIMNLQFEYDLINGGWESFEMTKATRNDRTDSKEGIGSITKDNLYIRDLGYVTPFYLRAVIEEKAYFLNRAPSQANIYTQKKELIDWGKIHRKFNKTGTNILEEDVLIYQKELLSCRMIVEAVNDDEYKKRLEQAKNSAKSRGLGVSDQHKVKCRYNIFITNISKDILSADKIRKAYYLRWQIELVFKTWKSFFEIDKIKNVKKDRMECQLLAKFLWILLNWHLFQSCNRYVRERDQEKGVSVLKFFKRCLSFTNTLRLVVLQRLDIDIWLKNVFLPLIENTACEPPKKKKTHYQVITDAFSH